jgi:hypothetical protein
MKVPAPVKTSVEGFQISVDEIEAILQHPPMKLPAWPDAYINLKDGRQLFIRAMKDEDVPTLLGFMEKVMKVEHDFYDIVAVRVYGEILAVPRKRIKDPFTLIGTIDGELVGFANGRMWDKDLGISLHTMAFSRRGRIGWAMYYAKTYYALEMAGAKEWWSTFESYNGWRMAGFEMAQPTKPFPQMQHELGGATIYYLTKEDWDARVKSYALDMIGDDLHFDPSAELKKKNATLTVPAELNL